MSEQVTVEHEGFRIDSNSGATGSAILTSLKPPAKEESPGKEDGKPDLSKAASELGKAGGEAAAKARAAEEKPRQIKPIPDKKPEEKGAEAAGKTDPEAGKEKPAKASDEDEGEQEKEKSRAQKRVEEATRAAAEARRRADESDRQRQALERRLAEVERRTAPGGEKSREEKRAPQDGKPKVEDFDDYEKYLDARDEWNRSRWYAEQKQQRQATERQSRYDQHAAEFSKHVKPEMIGKLSDEVKELRPSFSLGQGEIPTGSNFVADEIYFDPEKAVALMTHLSEHPEELQRLAALQTPRAVTREMARLSARLDDATAGASPFDGNPASKPEVSKAVPPVRPVTGTPRSIAEEGHTPERASRESLDDYARGWRPAKAKR